MVLSFEAAKQRNRQLLEETVQLGEILEKIKRLQDSNSRTSVVDVNGTGYNVKTERFKSKGLFSNPEVRFESKEIETNEAKNIPSTLNKTTSESADNLMAAIPPEMSTELKSDDVNRQRVKREPSPVIEFEKPMSPLARAAEIFSQSSSDSSSESDVNTANPTDSTIQGIPTLHTATEKSKTPTLTSKIPTSYMDGVNGTALKKENDVIDSLVSPRKPSKNSSTDRITSIEASSSERKSSRSKSISPEKEVVLQSPRVSDLRRQSLGSRSSKSSEPKKSSKKVVIDFSDSENNDLKSTMSEKSESSKGSKNEPFKFLESPRTTQGTVNSINSKASESSKNSRIIFAPKKMTPLPQSQEPKSITTKRASFLSSSSSDEEEKPWYEKEPKSKNQPKLFTTSFNALDDDEDSFSFE